MPTRRLAREPGARTAPHHRTLAPAPDPIPAGVLRAALGSLLSTGLVVGAVMAASNLVPAPMPTHAAPPSTVRSTAPGAGSTGAATDTLSLLLEATAGAPEAPHLLDQPAALSPANRGAVAAISPWALASTRWWRSPPLVRRAC